MKIQQVIEDIVNYNPTSELENLDKIFKKSGYEIRIVGGAVRDILLKKEPKDIDLATDATPKEMMDLLGQEDEKKSHGWALWREFPIIFKISRLTLREINIAIRDLFTGHHGAEEKM